MAFKLILKSGTGTGTEYPLEKTEIFLGRDLSNDIVINDPEVSRRHARLVLTGNAYAIEDLGSTNGTFLRGQRLTAPVVLTPGENITLGENVVIAYEFIPIDPDATVAAFRRPAPSASQPVAPAAQSITPAPQYTPPIAPTPPQYVAPQPVTPQYISPQPPEPEYVPHQVQSRPVAPVAPATPVQQVYTPIPPPEQVLQEPPIIKKRSGWLNALLVVIGILLVFCVIPWLIIELTNSYCALFPGIFNAIQPGVCP